jgi:hypothetical protein
MKKVIVPLYPNSFSIWRGGQYGLIEAEEDKDKGGKIVVSPFCIFVPVSN